MAVAETKKMFEDTFGPGNIPPQVAFIAFDFDRSAIEKCNLATDISSDFVQLPLTINPFLIYQSKQGPQKYEWMPEKNNLFIPELIELGSGQIRSNARLFSDLVYPCIEAAVNQAMARVLSLANDQNGYCVEHDDHVNVYLAMSLAGGTGSSLMFTISHMLRQQYNHAHVFGYGVMHSIFHQQDPFNILTPRIRSNTFASLLELDFFQSASFDSPVTHDFFGKQMTLTTPLFDEFYVIDNKNLSGGMVNSLTSLCNAIGCSMFYGCVNAGRNYSIDWKKRGLDWGDKCSWVHAFGVCQIVYKGAAMETLYRMRMAADFLNLIKGRETCDVSRVYHWLEVANLREDGDDYNKLLDTICPSDSIARIREPFLNPTFNVEEILLRLRQHEEKHARFWTQQHLSDVIKASTTSLRNEINKILHCKAGVSIASSFLSSLEEILFGYRNEMENEHRVYLEKSASLRQQMNDALSEYDIKSRRFFSRLVGLHRQSLEQVGLFSVKLLHSVLEAARREDAIFVFSNIINEVRALRSRVNRVAEMTQDLEVAYRDEIHRKEMECLSPSLFEIDLSYVDLPQMNDEVSDNHFIEFFSTLKTPLLEIDAAELEKTLMDYTSTLTPATRFRTREIMDIIQDMSDEEYEDLKQKILRRSAPLLSLHDRGLIKIEPSGAVSPISNMLKTFYVTAYKEDPETKTRIEADGNLLSGDNVRTSFIPSDSESMKQCIYVHRVDSAIMPYCIESLDVSMGEYSEAYNPHLGKDMQNLLKSVNFTIVPKV